MIPEALNMFDVDDPFFPTRPRRARKSDRPAPASILGASPFAGTSDFLLGMHPCEVSPCGCLARRVREAALPPPPPYVETEADRVAHRAFAYVNGMI